MRSFGIKPIDGTTVENKSRGVSIGGRRRECFCGMEDKGRTGWWKGNEGSHEVCEGDSGE